MKKLAGILLFCALISALLIACTPDSVPNDTTGQPVPTDYSVKVVDFKGQPLSDVIVTFYAKGSDEEVGMKLVKAETGSTTINLLSGDYYFTLTPPGNTSFYYDTAKCVLTAKDTSVTVSVYDYPTVYEEYFYVEDYTREPYAANGAGAYHAEILAGQMTYFVFTPTETGTFRVSFISNLALNVGNYGIPHF
ncbi:MAG: hypothetical protein IJY04_02590, partial [Clostridia bacterium]|nr:hypothetical protein [Clostridia bacterium]